MKVSISYNHELSETDVIITQNNIEMTKEIFMGRRVCDNCGHEKDTSGAKTCSEGHFICHSCAKHHIHCPLCGHTLR